MERKKQKVWAHYVVFVLMTLFVTIPAGWVSADPTMMEEMVPMRDGVLLYTRIYLPDPAIWGVGPYPTIVSTTPYGIGEPGEPPTTWPAFPLNGYAYVNQDNRGRNYSEGVWDRATDGFDGYDTIEWAAQQSWCNGKIGMTGSSAGGITTYLTAGQRPPHLVAIMPWIASADSQNDGSFQGGALKLETSLGWIAYVISGLSQSHIDSLGLIPAEIMAEKLANAMLLGDLFSHVGLEPPTTPLDSASWMSLPLSGIPGTGLLGTWDEYLANYAVQNELRDQYKAWPTIEVPALHVGGWHDLFSRGNLEAFVNIGENGVPYQKMFMTPGVHRTVGYYVPFDLRDRWFDYWLKGIDTGIMDEPAVTYYAMGADEWRISDQWPPSGVVYATYYLHHDGTLSTDFPYWKESPISYDYDPNDPVLSRGGRSLFIPAGSLDQRPVEPPNRDDVLVYSSEVLEEDVEVSGHVEVVLHASSDAFDTDFTAKLIDVHPDGSAMNVLDQIIRARFRESPKYEVLMEPGQKYEFTIDLGDTSQVFKAGHRIQVDISSSNFPIRDRNTNTGNSLYITDTADDVVVAENTIYHDLFHRSYVILPIVNGNIKVIGSNLGDDFKRRGLDRDIFEFMGIKGEDVTIRLDAAPWKSGIFKRATLMLTDKIRKIHLKKIDCSLLPNTIKVKLPKTGKYLVTVSEQPRMMHRFRYRGDYNLTLEASYETCQTLEPTRWVE